ncbi:MAG: hypothetical protein P1P88_14830 [Bacteroidales bacterium]|nr:hypothetical protein [Bacteroidales bacterium]
MNSIRNILFTFIVLLFFVVSCKKSNINPENIFTKIYADPNADISYYPLDIAENGSGGYYILGATAIDTTHTWLNTYVAKTDELGELQWSVILDVPYVNPVSSLINIGGDFYIFCMDEVSLGTHILKIDEAGQTASQVASLGSIIYPLAVSKTPDNGFLLLSYDRISRNTTMSKIDATFNITWQSQFNVIEDAEEILVDHLIKTGKNIPFFTGYIGSGNATHYFANGLYNYTLSLLFVSATNGDRTGIAQGYRYDGGASSLLSIQGNSFALSRFSFGSHFLIPLTNIDISSTTNISDFGGGKLAEIEANAETRVKRMTIAGKETVVFASNTNNNQVIIYAYDILTNELILKKYLGFSNPVTIGSLIQTNDGGIAILVQTMVTGRFKRIGLYKIPKEHLE